jgi:hypothetical protein
LTFLDFRVIKFFDPAALQAHQVVMVRAAGEFKYGFAAFKVVALKQSGLLKLSEYPVDGGKTDVLAFIDQCSINVLRGEMAHGAALKQVQDSEPW